MPLDVCSAYPSPRSDVELALERTYAWALKAARAQKRPDQALFAIVQGGMEPDLRVQAARALAAEPFPGFAIGGLSVGEPREISDRLVALTAAELPEDRPRYLMGVGTPPDLLHAIGCGVDMFDCVIPTHLAWQGTAFTATGRVRITRGVHQFSDEPLDATCACGTCKTFTRSYLYHLMKCSEPLGPRLLTLHNLHYYLQLMRDARDAIDAGVYGAFAREKLAQIDRHEHAELRASA
jgi:queuine tRNA-ribosyltransferase